MLIASSKYLTPRRIVGDEVISKRKGPIFWATGTRTGDNNGMAKLASWKIRRDITICQFQNFNEKEEWALLWVKPHLGRGYRWRFANIQNVVLESGPRRGRTSGITNICNQYSSLHTHVKIYYLSASIIEAEWKQTSIFFIAIHLHDKNKVTFTQ